MSTIRRTARSTTARTRSMTTTTTTNTEVMLIDISGIMTKTADINVAEMERGSKRKEATAPRSGTKDAILTSRDGKRKQEEGSDCASKWNNRRNSYKPAADVKHQTPATPVLLLNLPLLS
ncbi:hypothetical protein Mp_5g17850 [Marchantia polymorpha subsp. ruderalis]|uniref:Uncharacterized protein n=1 Tax=Marchantia polymorpha subsp. ruderalis TaxID=1480154 RepID=A0AAF6BJH3_MARPO|nr:hypothetical protein Mp_5g17850 [Marchantia polymorpha subsp. ruderalis]